MNWIDTISIPQNGYFNIQQMQGEIDKNRTVNTRILFNGLESENYVLVKLPQNALHQTDKTYKMCISELHTCPKPNIYGIIFYSDPSFDMRPPVKIVLNTLKSILI